MLNCIIFINNRRHEIKGTILQDVPETENFEELMELAVDRKEWRRRVRGLEPRPSAPWNSQCQGARTCNGEIRMNSYVTYIIRKGGNVRRFKGERGCAPPTQTNRPTWIRKVNSEHSILVHVATMFA